MPPVAAAAGGDRPQHETHSEVYTVGYNSERPALHLRALTRYNLTMLDRGIRLQYVRCLKKKIICLPYGHIILFQLFCILHRTYIHMLAKYNSLDSHWRDCT